MTQITLTEEQMKLLYKFPFTRISVCDPQGNIVGTVVAEESPEFIAELKRRAANSKHRYTGEQLQNHLKELEIAWDREGGFDEARMWEILDEIREKEKE